MRIHFRADANTIIGTGHLMRCLALAEALRSAGAECSFLCKAEGLGALAHSIIGAGHELLLLPQSGIGVEHDELAHAVWLPGGQKNDAVACMDALAGKPVSDWLVVDHYAIDYRWHSAMRSTTSRIMVIDDLADRKHDCDLLLDQNLVDNIEARYDNLLPASCERLLGPRFALLRKEFVRRDMAPERSLIDIPNLLVMFGGADAQDLTRRVIRVLGKEKWSGPVNVVAGPLYESVERLKEEVSRLPQGRLHAPAENVAALMRHSDLAVGSPGVASWERCACKLPTIAIAQADNQEEIGRVLGELGANFYLGRSELLTDDALSAALRAWLSNDSARKAMSRAAAAICDGDGLRRVVAKLMPYCISVQPVSRLDADLLFLWRNDERTRRNSLDPKSLILADHNSWVEQTLSRTDVDLLLAYSNEQPIACVRFDRNDQRAVVSIYTNPDLQRSGFGVPALLAALEWLQVNHPEIIVTDADVLQDNAASQALFFAAGYKPSWLRFSRRQVSTCS